MLETLIEIAPLLAGRKPPDIERAPRVAVVTTTGGGAASVVDRLGMHGIETASPDPEAPIIDLTMGRRRRDLRRGRSSSCSIFRGCDAVLAVVGSSAQFHPQLAVEPIIAAKTSAKPLAVFLTPQAEQSLALLAEAGIAAFRTPEACADALRRILRVARAARTATGIRSRVGRRAVPNGRRCDESQALALFRALGVPVVESRGGGSASTTSMRSRIRSR